MKTSHLKSGISLAVSAFMSAAVASGARAGGDSVPGCIEFDWTSVYLGTHSGPVSSNT